MTAKEEARFLQLKAQFETELGDVETELKKLTDEFTNASLKLIDRKNALRDLLGAWGSSPQAKAQKEKREAQDVLIDSVLEESSPETVEPKPMIGQWAENDLLTFLEDFPGSSKGAIREMFGTTLTEHELKNLIDRMSKRRQIVNHGSKGQPAWGVG